MRLPVASGVFVAAVGLTIAGASCVGDDPVTTPTPNADAATGETGGPDTAAPVEAGTGDVAPDTTTCSPAAPRELPASGHLAWNGNGFGLASIEVVNGHPELMFRILDATGALVGTPKQLTAETTDADAVDKHVHTLLFAGGHYAILWSRDPVGGGELFYTELDVQGVAVASQPTKVDDYAGFGLGSARMASAASNVGVVWLGTGVEFQIRALNGQAVMQQSLSLGLADGSTFTKTHPAIAAGNGYGIVWRDTRTGDSEIRFAYVDGTGQNAGGEVQITNSNGLSIRPVIVESNNGYGIAWEDSRHQGNPEIFFARVNATGTTQGGEVRVTDHPSAVGGQRLVWNGSEYGLLWQDAREGNDEIYFVRLSGTTDAKIGDETRLTTTTTNTSTMALFWTNDRYRFAWSEDVGSGATTSWLGEACP